MWLNQHLNSPLDNRYLLKYRGHENKGNDQQSQNLLIFNQILPTSPRRQYLKNTAEENRQVDIKVQRAKIEAECGIPLFLRTE